MIGRWGTFQRRTRKTALNLKPVIRNLDLFGNPTQDLASSRDPGSI